MEEMNNNKVDVTFSGWYFLRIFLFLLPGLGLILSIYSVVKNKEHRSNQNFAKAFVVWNCLSILFMLAAMYIALGYVRVADSSLHYYFGDYGSTGAIVEQLLSGDVEGAINKLDLEKFAENVDVNGFLETDAGKKILSLIDLSKADLSAVDFTKVDWSQFTDEEITALINAIPKKTGK